MLRPVSSLIRRMLGFHWSRSASCCSLSFLLQFFSQFPSETQRQLQSTEKSCKNNKHHPSTLPSLPSSTCLPPPLSPPAPLPPSLSPLLCVLLHHPHLLLGLHCGIVSSVYYFYIFFIRLMSLARCATSDRGPGAILFPDATQLSTEQKCRHCLLPTCLSSGSRRRHVSLVTGKNKQREASFLFLFFCCCFLSASE